MSNDSPGKKTYWFPAKKYGWGWGFPTTWQGWVVLVLYPCALSLSTYAFPPHERPFAFVLSVILVSVALVAICWIKGEPPAWRWGKQRREGRQAGSG